MRTITVKGAGTGSVRPDCIRISIELKAKDLDYSIAMELANVQTEELQKAVRAAGIRQEELKTTNLNVRTEYESVPDGRGGFQQEMNGYCCTHQMVLELPLDFELLSEVLHNVSDCDACPECRIAFTLCDPRAAEERLLCDAANNALERAEILANASGCQLGELQHIDYRLGSLDPFSRTSFGVEDGLHLRSAKFMAFTPEDIKLSEDVSFTWELI
ncbi:MAG: SIMPL domain-containing protein [Oscillospiraceae bacterium]|nr:SIMPL domain-containing protein [Oscillospiraceae bacterium]